MLWRQDTRRLGPAAWVGPRRRARPNRRRRRRMLGPEFCPGPQRCAWPGLGLNDQSRWRLRRRRLGPDVSAGPNHSARPGRLILARSRIKPPRRDPSRPIHLVRGASLRNNRRRSAHPIRNLALTDARRRPQNDSWSPPPHCRQRSLGKQTTRGSNKTGLRRRTLRNAIEPKPLQSQTHKGPVRGLPRQAAR